MKRPVKLLLVFLDESDMKGDMHVYEVIVRRLHQLDVNGATVQAGIMGFGSHGKLHRKGLFGFSDDRPITIMVADEEAKIRRVIPEIRDMVREGLLLVVDAEDVTSIVIPE